MKKLRVAIPAKDVNALLMLAKNVLDKHLEDGDETVLDKFDWQRIQPAIKRAMIFHEKAEALRGESQRMLQDRNLLIVDIVEDMRNIRDVLTGLNKKNMKTLSAWGYDVIEAPERRNKKSDETVDNE